MQWVKIFSGQEEADQRIAEGKPQLLVLYGKRIALVRFRESYRAVQDACTHSGASLSQGHVNYLGEIICPLHNYQFDLHTGAECNSRASDLKLYPVKIDETGFYVGLW